MIALKRSTDSAIEQFVLVLEKVSVAAANKEISVENEDLLLELELAPVRPSVAIVPEDGTSLGSCAEVFEAGDSPSRSMGVTLDGISFGSCVDVVPAGESLSNSDETGRLPPFSWDVLI